ncbi:MAG: type II secretion system protein [Clostridia bacterium]|nr:type II secretion system protein [Clostridia bacterium]
MIKNINIKEERGITLITLIITVILLVIVTTILATNSYTSLQLSNLTRLQNDIEVLDSRIASYFIQSGELPIYKSEYAISKSELSSKIKGVSINDGDTYYTIDLSQLDNITLNYGEGYRALTNDRYIINEKSHVIYYLEGIKYDGDTYHTIGANKPIT